MVLTAGHLFLENANGEITKPNGGITKVQVGIDVANPVSEVPVTTAIRHEGFRRNGEDASGELIFPRIQNDVGLLILDKEVAGIAPRQFAPVESYDTIRDITAVGFGATDENGEIGFGKKRQGRLAVVSTECGDFPGGGTDREVYGCQFLFEMVAEALVQGKGKNGGTDTCKGDSGGPIYIKTKKDGPFFLAACVSRTTKKAVRACGDGGIYVRVDRFEDWIRRTAAANGGNVPPR